MNNSKFCCWSLKHFCKCYLFDCRLIYMLSILRWQWNRRGGKYKIVLIKLCTITLWYLFINHKHLLCLKQKMFCNFKHNSNFDLHKIYLNSDYYTYILEDYKRFLNCTIWCIWKGSRKTHLHAWKGKSLVNALSFHVLPHFLYIYLSFYPYIYPSIHPFIYLSIHLSLCLSSYLSNYPSFYLSIYPVSIYIYI